MRSGEIETIIWLVTPKCNLRCRHCYASIYSGERELSLNEAKAFLEEAACLGVKHVHLTGGEPLIRNDIFDIIEAGVDYGLQISIFTNASLINDEVAERLNDLNVFVFTSLDGPNKRVHEAVRGEGAWDSFMKGISYLINEGVEFHINISVNEVNWMYVGDTLRKAAELTPISYSVIPSMPAGRALSEDVWVRPNHYFKALKDVEEVAKELGIIVDAWCTPFLDLVLPRTIHVRASNCRDWGVMDVSPSGRVVLCDVMNVEVGNVVRDGVEGAWERLKNREVMRKLLRKPSFKPCSTCEAVNYCRGGCYARAYALNGSVESPDPLCPRVAGLIK